MANRQNPDKRELSFYQELSIEFDPAEVHWADGTQQNASEIEKRVVVKNGSQPVEECQVVLEELAYHFGDEWADPPNGYEQKALRWDEKRAAQEGQIEIAAHGSAKLEIVRLYRFPNPYFGIAYNDGSYGKTHHFVGAYRLRLRLEAKTSDRSGIWVFAPIVYEVYLSYVGALELEIEDIVRASAT